MIKLKDGVIYYDIYETRASLNAAVKGAPIKWGETKHNESTGEFAVPYAPPDGSYAVVLDAPQASNLPDPRDEIIAEMRRELDALKAPRETKPGE